MTTQHLSTAEEDISSYHILIAEDNEVNQKLIARYIERFGCSFVLVPDGAEALAAAKTGAFDLVLMDCQMPKYDGFEATRLIRQWETASSASRIPIVALTADAMDGARQQCLDAGMDDFLTKPLRRGALRAAMQHWLLQPAG